MVSYELKPFTGILGKEGLKKKNHWFECYLQMEEVVIIFWLQLNKEGLTDQRWSLKSQFMNMYSLLHKEYIGKQKPSLKLDVLQNCHNKWILEVLSIVNFFLLIHLSIC